jgi:hypothetical protein
MLVLCKLSVHLRLLSLGQRSWIRLLSRHDGVGIICRIPWFGGYMERDVGEESVHCLQHHQSFPPELGALGAGKVLEGTFEVLTQDPDTLEVWAWLQQWDIAPNKGSNFIVGDSCIHFWFNVTSCMQTVCVCVCF